MWRTFTRMAFLGIVTVLLVGGCGRVTSTSTTTGTTTTTSTTAATKTGTTSPTASTPATIVSPTVTTTAKQPAKPQGELRIAVASFSRESFDPTQADPTTGGLLSPMFDWMFRMEAGKLVPGIVQKWDIAPDGLSWTYIVRKGVKFHDGSDLTAKDVKFSIERYMEKGAYNRTMQGVVNNVQLVDDYTIRVFTKTQQPFLPLYMTSFSPTQGLVMPMAYINKNGVDYFIKNPIGSGPFQLAKYNRGDLIQYTALESHWRVIPAFKTLTIMQIPEPATRVAMLRSGDIDATDVSLEDAAVLDKAGFTTYAMLAGQPRLQLPGNYDPRAKGKPASDIRVRQALAISVDQEEISKSFFGKTLPLMPPRVLYGQDDVDTPYWESYTKKFYQYDPAKARRLLAEAGYPDGFNINIYLTQLNNMNFIPSLGQIVQQYWKQIGVKATLLPLDLTAYVNNRGEPGEMLVGNALFGSTSNLAPALLSIEAIWGSKGQTPLTAWNSPQGRIAYTPKLDELIYAAMEEINQVKRQALMAEAITIAMDTHTAFTFGQVPQMMAVGPKVKFNLKQPLEVPYIAQYADNAERR